MILTVIVITWVHQRWVHTFPGWAHPAAGDKQIVDRGDDTND